MKVDLHMHSVYSDGERTPRGLMDLAAIQRLSCIAITDHDSVGAYAEAKAHEERTGVRVIPGIELNTYGPNGELHILGYGFDPEHPLMKAHCEWRLQERESWSRKIVGRLNRMGYDIRWDDCRSKAEGGVIVRTHIAKVLVEHRYFHDEEEAFDRLLASGSPGYIERETYSSEEAIALIHECGGLAFLAHPGAYRFGFSIDRVADEGLDGIEVYYTGYSELETVQWWAESERLGLLKSVGSDFHGEASRNPQLPGSVDYDHEDVHGWLQQILPDEELVR